jgi:hypothetical protein
MLDSLRRSYAEMVTSGTQLLLLFVGFHFSSRQGWLYCLGLMAIISLFAWYSTLHRLRTITGTPTSNVASAAQGYVELQGSGRVYGETPLLGKLSLLPCLWYRYRIEEKNAKNEWRTKDTGESNEPFMLNDGSGNCIVDPTGAEIITKHKDTWHESAYRYTEWKLINSDNIYTIGHFKTAGGSTVERTLNDEIKQVLWEWKLDMPQLKARFDLNNDGIFDDKEWLLARQAAKREAEKRLIAARAEPDLNFMMRPKDGRLFLISNFDQDKLARRYLLWAWAHVIILFGALGGIVWVMNRH